MATAVSQAPVIDDSKTQVDLSTIPISPGGSASGTNDESKKASGEEQITVFHDKDNFNVIHPLMHTWTLWFTKPPSGKVRIPRVFLIITLLTAVKGRQLE